MSRDKKNLFKKIVIHLIGGLIIVSIILFVFATISGNRNADTTGHESEIHIFINQNDSIVYKMQEDIEKLSKLIEKMNSDTVIIEMIRANSVGDAVDSNH